MASHLRARLLVLEGLELDSLDVHDGGECEERGDVIG